MSSSPQVRRLESVHVEKSWELDSKMKRALHFGAGNIGRGFIGKVLADSGYDVVFADVVPVLIDNLSKRKSYQVNIVGDRCTTEQVKIKGAVYSNKEEVIDEIAKADLITTAVGPRVLERLASSIAKGITVREESGNNTPVNIIACENAIRATSTLKSFVVKELDKATCQWMEKMVGFVDSAVDRIVPPAKHSDPLEVTVEDFSEWVLDSTQVVGAQKDAERPLPIKEAKFTTNLTAFIERKLLTVNTGHAICAYLGHLNGYKDIRSAILDPKIKAVVEGAMRESGAVLVKQFNMDADEHEAYIQKILTRYANPHIHDDVLRVGREPIRKLSPEDRLVKPLRYCLTLDLPYDNLIIGIAAALLFTNPDDPQAVELSKMVNELGVPQAFCQISGLPQSSVDKVASQVRTLGGDRVTAERVMNV